MNRTTRAQRIKKHYAKANRTAQCMAFADHVYAASEDGTGAASEPRKAAEPPRGEPADTMTTEDRKEQLGEECVYCGKDSWTCEHFKPEDNQ